jgi:hypothetical protein
MRSRRRRAGGGRGGDGKCIVMVVDDHEELPQPYERCRTALREGGSTDGGKEWERLARSRGGGGGKGEGGREFEIDNAGGYATPRTWSARPGWRPRPRRPRAAGWGSPAGQSPGARCHALAAPTLARRPAPRMRLRSAARRPYPWGYSSRSPLYTSWHRSGAAPERARRCGCWWWRGCGGKAHHAWVPRGRARVRKTQPWCYYTCTGWRVDLRQICEVEKRN